MEVIVLCISLLVNVFLLIAAQGHERCTQQHDAAVVRVVPTRLQFFEYESLSFTCDGLSGSAKWKGVRNVKEFLPTCSNSTATLTVTCPIYNAFETDSGEYWCETGAGERSEAVNITITGGPVILESPFLPVKEGEAFTLRCRKKGTLLNNTAAFFKNGIQLWTGYNGKMTIQNVSKSDEGHYKCSISGVGESPESWLAVRNQSIMDQEDEGSVLLECPVLPVMEGDAVTLNCRNKSSTANLPAVFFKDGFFIGSGSEGNMTIHSVYKSHEGLYKCNVSGVGESQGRWLSVRALQREACFCLGDYIHVVFLVRTVLTIVMVALLLLLVGLLHCGKLSVTRK